MSSVLSAAIQMGFFTFMLMLFGRKVKNNEKYYCLEKQKGTLYGKVIFSILFTFSILLVFFLYGVDSSLKGITIVFLLVAGAEAKDATKEGKELFFLITVWFLVVGLLSPVFLLNDPMLIIFVILVSVLADTGCSFIGPKLKRIFGEKSWIILRYPKEISGNKSFMAVIICFISLFLFFVFISIGINFLRENENYYIHMLVLFNDTYVLLVFPYAFIGTILGDAYFSYYKRVNKRKDFYPTLGPIGGLLDRINGWVFGIFITYFILIKDFL